MKKKLKMVSILLGTALMITLLSSSTFRQGDRWEAPPEADKLVNPLTKDAKAWTKGQKIYYKMCWTCHGKQGKGDGPASVALIPKPADHTSKIVQDQSDGAIYWKITNGRSPMPTFGQLLSKTQRWQLTQYIRNLPEK